MSERFTISGGDVSGYRVIDVDTGHEVTGALHRDSERAHEEAQRINQDIEKAIQKAALHDIALTPDQFQVMGGDVYLDSMDPDDWIKAMTMD